MIQTISDFELIEAANNGQTSAFSALLERYYDLIYRVALRTLGNTQDAEDISQDVCVDLANKLASFQGKSKFSTWLYQITLNKCRDFMRSKEASRKTQRDYSEVFSSHQQVNESRREALEWAYLAIDRLTEPLRETAILVVAEGLNHAEAAEILLVKESTVSWRMMEVKKKLKEHETFVAGVK